MAVFAALSRDPQIEFIDMPHVIRDKYHYVTEASIEKLRKTGYAGPKFTLEDGVFDYVRNHLVPLQYLEVEGKSRSDRGLFGCDSGQSE